MTESVILSAAKTPDDDNIFHSAPDCDLDQILAFFAMLQAGPKKAEWERAIFDRHLPLERRRRIAEAYRTRFDCRSSQRTRAAMASSCVEEREVAARMLSGQDAIEPLASALTSGIEALEDAAAEALSRSASVRATRLLAGRVLDEQVPMRRAFFLRKLKTLPGREAERVLEHFLDDAHADVRLSALFGLADKPFAPAAAQKMVTDRDARVRLLALSLTDDADHDLSNDPDFAVRCAAGQLRIRAGA